MGSFYYQHRSYAIMLWASSDEHEQIRLIALMHIDCIDSNCRWASSILKLSNRFVGRQSLKAA